MNSTPTIAVHLHIFYTDMWDLMRSYLTNLQGTPYHLYVTLIRENRQLAEKIKSFHAESTIWVVENRGYDVGPFLYFLHQIDLSQYDYILKLHTKGNMPDGIREVCERYMGKTWWRTLMLQSVLGSKQQVLNNLEIFEQNPKVGMLGSEYLIVDTRFDTDIMRDYLQSTLEKLGYSNTRHDTFIAGTIFMVRSSLMQIIKDNFTLADFEPSQKGCHDGTLAHVMERLLGILPQVQGYTLQGVGKNKRYERIRAWQPILLSAYGIWFRIRNFIFRRVETKSKHLLIKICKIPVWYSALPQDKNTPR